MKQLSEECEFVILDTLKTWLRCPQKFGQFISAVTCDS